MNINYKQPQFELFPANSATLEDINKPRFLLANLTLSLESLVILAILGIMVALFSFSLGVEHGKSLAARTLDERVAAAWNVSHPAAVAAPAAAAPAMAKALPKPLVDRGFIVGTGGRYTLQAATYGNEQYAQADALVLKERGFPTFLIRNGKYWLLCIGNFNSKEAASGFVRKLPVNYRSSQVRRF